MASESPIQVENVSYFYGKGNLRKQILFDVSTEIAAGEIVILTGPSGSGKTTLLTLIGALRSCQQGVVRVMNSDLSAVSESALVKVRRRIGYIFQQHNLLASLSVAQNIQMALELGGERSRKGWNERIETVLNHVGMAEHMYKMPDQLSGGQKQRIGIATGPGASSQHYFGGRANRLPGQAQWSRRGGTDPAAGQGGRRGRGAGDP